MSEKKKKNLNYYFKLTKIKNKILNPLKNTKD